MNETISEIKITMEIFSFIVKSHRKKSEKQYIRKKCMHKKLVHRVIYLCNKNGNFMPGKTFLISACMFTAGNYQHFLIIKFPLFALK